VSKTIDLFGSAFRLHAREAALLFYLHQAHRPDALAVWLGRLGAK
jgi:hypothetical protein